MASLNLAKFCCLNSDCDYFVEFAFGNIKLCGNIPKTGGKATTTIGSTLIKRLTMFTISQKIKREIHGPAP
jgi:hypothetical protein